MKQLLVPTDFSEPARVAFAFAIEIANAFDSTIHLLHTYQIKGSAGMLVSIAEIVQTDAEADMKSLKSDLPKKMADTANLKSYIFRGQLLAGIDQLTELVGVDLIVMGTKGASGLKEIFWGSNAKNVVERSKIPVMVIPGNCVFKPIKKVVLAVDEYEMKDQERLQPLVKIARFFNASIYIYHHSSKDQGNTINSTVIDSFSDFKYEVIHHFSSENVGDALNEFLKEEEPDLVSLIRRKRGWLEQLMHNSVTTQELFHSHYPLLILRDE